MKLRIAFERVSAFLVKRTARCISQHIESACDAAHMSGYRQGYQKGHAEGKVTGHSEGSKVGRDLGYKEGSEHGQQIGYEAGKSVWVIEDRQRPSRPTPIDMSIYGPQRFAVTEDIRRRMREKVADLVARKLIDPPTEAQWDMIFATSPATCVIAGAGSGKSTTLVLRVVLMLEYLGVTQDATTIVSFTKASCHELRLSLIDVLAHWNPRKLTYAEAKRLIRTFHSALYRVAVGAFPGISFFETYTSVPRNCRSAPQVDHCFSVKRLGHPL
jgi:hypothetical protein